MVEWQSTRDASMSVIVSVAHQYGASASWNARRMAVSWGTHACSIFGGDVVASSGFAERSQYVPSGHSASLAHIMPPDLVSTGNELHLVGSAPSRYASLAQVLFATLQVPPA